MLECDARRARPDTRVLGWVGGGVVTVHAGRRWGRTTGRTKRTLPWKKDGAASTAAVGSLIRAHPGVLVWVMQGLSVCGMYRAAPVLFVVSRAQ